MSTFGIWLFLALSSVLLGGGYLYTLLGIKHTEKQEKRALRQREFIEKVEKF